MPFTDGDFFGEASPFDWWKDITGTVIAGSFDNDGYEMTYKYPPMTTALMTQRQYYFTQQLFGTPVAVMPDSLTFMDGDSFMGECYPSTYYLTASTPAEFILAIDVGPSSSGTFRVSAGGDPDWNLTSPALASTVLGTYDVIGAQRFTAKIEGVPAYTNDNFLSYDLEPLIYVEVLAGTVEFSYIRVRVWPPSGPSGAWRPISGTYTTTGHQPAMVSSGAGVSPSGPGPFGGWPSAGPDHSGPFGDMQQAFSDARSGVTYVNFSGQEPESTWPDGNNTGANWQYNWALEPIGYAHEFSGYNNMSMVLIWGYNIWESGNPDSSINGGFTYNDPDITPYDDYGASRGGVGVPALGYVSGWSGDLTWLANDLSGHIAYRMFPSDIPAWTTESHSYGSGRLYHAYTAPPSLFAAAATPWDLLIPPATGVYETSNGIVPISHPDTTCWGIEVYPYQLVTPEDDIALYDPWNSSLGAGSWSQGGGSIGFGNLRFDVTFTGIEVFDPSLPYVSDDGPPVVQFDPRGGYYLIPGPDLDGQGLEVKVNFAQGF